MKGSRPARPNASRVDRRVIWKTCDEQPFAHHACVTKIAQIGRREAPGYTRIVWERLLLPFPQQLTAHWRVEAQRKHAGAKRRTYNKMHPQGATPKRNVQIKTPQSATKRTDAPRSPPLSLARLKFAMRTKGGRRVLAAHWLYYREIRQLHTSVDKDDSDEQTIQDGTTNGEQLRLEVRCALRRQKHRTTEEVTTGSRSLSHDKTVRGRGLTVAELTANVQM